MIMFQELRSLTLNFALEIGNKKRNSEELERSEAGLRLASCRLAVALTEDLLGTARPRESPGSPETNALLQGDSLLVLQVQDSYLQDSWDGDGVGVNARARRADSLNGFVRRPASLMLLPGLDPSPCHTLRFRQLLEPTKLALRGPHRGCTRWNTSPLLVPSPLNMSA